MKSSLTGFRNPAFRFKPLDNRWGDPIPQRGFTAPKSDIIANAGSLDFSQQATIKGSGDMRTSDRGVTPYGRVRVEYVLDPGTNFEQSWVIGSFFTSSPSTTFKDGRQFTDVELYDNLLAMHEDSITEGLVVPEGSDPLAEVSRQMGAASLYRADVTPTAKRLRTALTFEPGTTRLQVVNALLAAADYFSLWCNGEGVYQVKPYTPPRLRPVEWVFKDGESSIIVDDVTVESSDFNAPNRVLGVSRADGLSKPLVAVATVTDTSSPFHRDNLGRWRTELLDGGDADVTSQSDLQARVDRRLAVATTAVRKVVIQHGWVPLQLNSVAELDLKGVKGRFVVVNQTIPLDPTQLVTTTLREAFE